MDFLPFRFEISQGRPKLVSSLDFLLNFVLSSVNEWEDEQIKGAICNLDWKQKVSDFLNKLNGKFLPDLSDLCLNTFEQF